MGMDGKPAWGYLLGRAMLGGHYLRFVGTDKSNDFDHFAKAASVRSEIT